MHDQRVLSPVRGLVCDPRPRRRVGPHRGFALRRAGSGEGEPDPGDLDRGSSGAPVVGPGAAGAPVRLASVLGHGGAGRRAALHAGAADDAQQRRLARLCQGNGSSPCEGHGDCTIMKHRSSRSPGKRRRLLAGGTAIIAAAAIAAGGLAYNRSADPAGPLPDHLPVASGASLGVYTQGVPVSYDRVTAFTSATGAKPDVVMYYSGWFQPFQTTFAAKVAQNGAVPLVQMDPDGKGVTVPAIAAGKYDGYLSAYAEAVRAYGHPVILSFGHEMNGSWSPWGYQHTSPAAFVAAWRHIVMLFRALGAQNVTWLWTVNIVNDTPQGRIPPPGPWWPGSAYVTWVGIDGYYLKSSWQFPPLFVPTTPQVRA